MLRKNTEGFTLIELLIVIAIIGILTAFFIANIGNVLTKARDAQRKSDLKQLQTAIESFYSDNGIYPNTESTWFSSEPDNRDAGTNGGDWIPGLVSKYIKVLPRDPVGGTGLDKSGGGGCAFDGWKKSYMYRSDGINYALLSHCALEDPSSYNEKSFLLDSERPTWSIKVCAGEGCTW